MPLRPWPRLGPVLTGSAQCSPSGQAWASRESWGEGPRLRNPGPVLPIHRNAVN